MCCGRLLGGSSGGGDKSHAVVIPGRREAASPESITTVLRNDCRTKPCGPSWNDDAVFLAIASCCYCAIPSKRSIQSGFVSSISRIFQSRRHFLMSLYSRNRVFRIIADLIPNKPVHAIARCKARNRLLLVFVNTANEIVRNADVQRSVLAACQ